MIDVSKLNKAIREYGLGAYKVQKYAILSGRVTASISKGKLNLITLQDVNDLCDLLCCRPEDVINYEYVDPDEAEINAALANGDALTDDGNVDDSIRSDIIKELLG